MVREPGALKRRNPAPTPPNASIRCTRDVFRFRMLTRLVTPSTTNAQPLELPASATGQAIEAASALERNAAPPGNGSSVMSPDGVKEMVGLGAGGAGGICQPATASSRQ